MIDILKYKSIATRVLGRGGLLVQKYSPEILLGAGIAGGAVSLFLACKATLKIEAVMMASAEDLGKVEYGHETMPKEKYSDEDYKKDLLTVHVQRAINIGKLYLPAATVGLGALACILGSHGIMTKRQVGLMAAYKLIEESYKGYRKRVVEQLGAEKEEAIHYDVAEETTTETTTNAKGKEVKTKKTLYKFGTNSASQYAKWFNADSPQWQRTNDYNLFFLNSSQNHMNDELKARGHLFLNEVYDLLGIPRTTAGQMVGWVMNSEKGDNKVDFGILSPRNQDFVNSYTNELLLDFNVDGPIFELI